MSFMSAKLKTFGCFLCIYLNNELNGQIAAVSKLCSNNYN